MFAEVLATSWELHINWMFENLLETGIFKVYYIIPFEGESGKMSGFTYKQTPLSVPTPLS